MAKITTKKYWPTTHEHHVHMKLRKQQNIAQSKSSAAEQWMFNKLMATTYKWSRQAQWGFRLFDFWCHEKGIAIEVDGPEHDALIDEIKDISVWERSRIIVLRVPNFDEGIAEDVIGQIIESPSWNERRVAASMSVIKT